MTTVTAPPLAMTKKQRRKLEVIARSTSKGHRKVVQAKALLLAADGVGTNEWPASATPPTIRCALGVDGSTRRVSMASGGSRRAGTDVVASRRHGRCGRPRHAPRQPDDGSTHWTTRLMAGRLGIGKDTVARIWRDHELKPWKVETFKIPPTPASRRSSSTSSGSTSTRPSGRSCSASTRRPRSKRSIAPSPASDETWAGRDDDPRLQA